MHIQSFFPSFHTAKDRSDLQGEGKMILRFSAISGSFPESGIAVPLYPLKVTRSAIQQLFLYKGRSFLARLKIHLLALCAPFLGVFFRKQFSVVVDSSEENLVSFLATGLKMSERDLAFSMYRGSRKFILPLFDSRSSVLLGYAKVYLPGVESAEYGKREVAVLNRLKKLHLQNVDIPDVLFSGYFKGYFVVILSSISSLRSMSSVTFRHITWLKNLTRETGVEEYFSQSSFFATIQKEVALISEKIPEKKELINGFFKKAVEHLEGREFLFSLTKREFPFFEMMEQQEGGLFVVDWELAQLGFPPVFDVFSLLISEQRRRGDYVKIYVKNLKETFFVSNRRTWIYLSECFSSLCLSSGEAYWFFWLFLLDQLYIHLHVDHVKSAERIVTFLEEVKRNEAAFARCWLGGGH